MAELLSVTGDIQHADGAVTHFKIGSDGGWSQWGIEPSRLGETRDLVADIAGAAGQYLLEQL